MTGLIDAVESTVPDTPQPKKDPRQVVVDSIEHIRQWWLIADEYDPIQPEIDAIIARIHALPVDNLAVFQAELRKIVDELKGRPTHQQATAQDLLTNFINNSVSTDSIDFIRRQAKLFIAVAIEMHI